MYSEKQGRSYKMLLECGSDISRALIADLQDRHG